jgi:hypothetical protein
MSDNIVSKLDTKSYLLLLRELNNYYKNKTFCNIPFYIIGIQESRGYEDYEVLISGLKNIHETHYLTEKQLCSIIRIAKINKINEIPRIN